MERKNCLVCNVIRAGGPSLSTKEAFVRGICFGFTGGLNGFRIADIELCDACEPLWRHVLNQARLKVKP